MIRNYYHLVKTVFLCLGLSTPIILIAQDSEIKGDLANIVTEDSRPNWIELNPETNLDPKAFLNLLNGGNSFKEGSSLDLSNISTDKQGKTRHVYQQSYQGIPIDNSIWVLHETKGRVDLAQGSFFTPPQNDNPRPNLTERQALIHALDAAQAKTYAWEVPALEESLQEINKDPFATYYPKGELVWASEKDGTNLQLAYKFDIYAVDPIQRKEYFINAKTGFFIRSLDVLNGNCFSKDHTNHNHSTNDLTKKEITENTLNFLNATGTGIANYITANGGQVNLETTLDGGVYTLRATNIGPLNNQTIETVNANNLFSIDNLTDFTDVDNVWDTDPVAVGAHWGAQTTYDYYLNTFNRVSFDNDTATVVTVVHYGANHLNAYWDQNRMLFGDADGGDYSALTSLDIIAHEFTHGVTQYNGTGGLVYADESGALNESFSDIFGAVVEFLYHPDGGDWLIGEDFDLANSEGFRSMSAPNDYGHPKNYLGKDWFDGLGDNGGVHRNSSVQNHWFYLLCEGGSGLNDFEMNYNITPIGMEKAAAIAYYNLTHYMTPYATYQDAMNGSLNAAQILYPNDMALQNTVAAAWCAVGVGNGCGPTITIDEPVANEIVVAGGSYLVNWSKDLLQSTAKVNIQYTSETGNAPSWITIAENQPNNGTYSWFVPSEYSDSIRVQVVDAGNPTEGRVGNSDILGLSPYFKIIPCIAENSFIGPNTTAINEALSFSSTLPTGSYEYEWKIDGDIKSIDPVFGHVFAEAGIYEVTFTANRIGGTCFNEETRRIYVLNKNSSGFNVQVGDIDNGGGRASGKEILQTQDGGYIFFTIYSAQAFKMDALGNAVWQSESFPRPSDRQGTNRLKAIEKANGNILIAMVNSDTIGNTINENLLIIEIDGTDGTVINSSGQQFGLTGSLFPHQIIATDTSYIIGGSYQTSTGDYDIFLLELKASDLSVIDQKWIGDDSRIDSYGDLIPTADGGYLLGWMQSGGYPELYGLIKYDKDFQQEWKQGLYSNVSRPGVQSRMKIVETPNCGGYVILGFANEYAKSALIAINVLGNVQWAKRYNVPEFFNGQLISFHDMVWDGNNGVTLLGINGTALNFNGYPVEVEYQILNVGFDGEMNWKRKVTDLDVILPSFPSHDLFNSNIIRAVDGGYLAAIPGADGGESYLLKMDSMGLDGCALTNTNIAEEDIASTFSIELDISKDLNSPPTIQKIANFPFFVDPPIIILGSPNCSNVGDTLIAAYTAENFTLLVDSIPNITNFSRGANSYVWKVNGNPVNFPIANFDSVGVYKVTLEASNASNTSTVSYQFNVVNQLGCTLPCDLELVRSYTLDATCPDTEDAQIYSEAKSDIGRTFTFELWDTSENILVTQNTGFFTGLATGEYIVKVLSTNDESCVLTLDTFKLIPKVDISPPQAICQTASVDAAFVHAAIGVPYNHGNYVNEMTAGLTPNDWYEMTYESVNAEKLFSDSYNYIYLEGSDNNADELETFLGTNQQIIEDWVAAGNALFLNAAPGEGDGMSFGFGGVELVRGTYDSAYAVLPLLDGLTYPLTTMGGYPYSKGAIICPPSMNANRVLESANGTDLLVEATWGAGTVLFGGMNLTGFHQPSAETYAFKINLHKYLSAKPAATVNSPVKIYLDENKTYSLPVNEIDLGSFDDCELLSVALDTSEFDCDAIGLLNVALIATDVANNVAICTTQVEILDSVKIRIYETICKGEEYEFDNEQLKIAGVYEKFAPSASGCPEVTELTLTVLDTSRTELIETICQGETYPFKGGILIETGVYLDTLPNANACDSFIILNLTVLDTNHTELVETICEGQGYPFKGGILIETGVYFDTLLNANACDSFIVLDLTVLDTSYTELIDTICQGETYLFRGGTLTETGVYLDTLPNSNTCDSFIVLNLTVLDTSHTELIETICEGQTYPFKGGMLTKTGVYLDTLPNANACDSFIVLNLMVLDTSHTELIETICQGETYPFRGGSLTETGIYFDTLPNANACDSFIILDLTVLDTSYTELTDVICQGETYPFRGGTITEAGVYLDTLPNANACDSVIVLTLMVLDTSYTELTEVICQGETYPFKGETLTETGIYLDTLPNTNACDSFIVLNLTVIDTNHTALIETICEGQTYPFKGETLTETGVYLDTLSNANACDSFIVLNLTVLDTSYTELTEVICKGEIYSFRGGTITEAGVYLDTLPNANACDSVIVLTLTVLDTSYTELTEVICKGETYPFKGESLTETGVYLDTLPNSNACDSFIVLNLTVLDTSHTELIETICQGETYPFKGGTLTETGVYLDTLPNANACDSFIVLNLTVLDTSHTELIETICQGETYPFRGGNLTGTGIYLDTLPNSNACDSFIVLNLTVLDTSYTELIDTICQGEGYPFSGGTLTETGVYLDTLPNANACDSVIVLTLTVLDTVETVLNIKICQNDSYSFKNQLLTEGGIYRDTLESSNQCDSFVVLNLTIDTSRTIIAEGICPGEFYTFNNQDLTVAGEYLDTLQNTNLCDSFIVLNLFIDTSRTSISRTICEGDSYTFDNQELTVAGEYIDTLQNANLCDSIVVLTLVVGSCEGSNCEEENLIINGPMITKGEYNAAETITSNGETASTDTIVYRAGTMITLEPGFYVPLGSVFTAMIDDTICDNTGEFIEEIPIPSNQRQGPINKNLTKNELLVSPNPFYHATKISYSLSKAQKVRLAVYTIDGQLISVIKDGVSLAGNHSETFDLSNRKSGMYLVFLQTEKEVLTQKIIRLE